MKRSEILFSFRFFFCKNRLFPVDRRSQIKFVWENQETNQHKDASIVWQTFFKASIELNTHIIWGNDDLENFPFLQNYDELHWWHIALSFITINKRSLLADLRLNDRKIYLNNELSYWRHISFDLTRPSKIMFWISNEWRLT